MAEIEIPATKARAQFLELSKASQRTHKRIMITNRGVGESVLMGRSDYDSMKATLELFMHREVLEQVHANLADLEQGKEVSLEDAFPEMKDQVAEKIKVIAGK